METMSNDSSQVDTSVAETYRTVKFTFYGLVFFFSIFGNMLVICSIVKFKRQRTFPNIFVLNLSLCDICLVTLSIPASIINDVTGEFAFGRVGCYALWPMATFAMNSAVFTLLAIAIERYVAVIHPFSFVLSKNKIALILFILHLFSLLSVLPYACHLTLSRGAKLSCEETWSRTSRKIYTVFLFLIQYGIPLPVIVGLSIIAWNRIRVQNATIIKIAEKSRRQTTMQWLTKNGGCATTGKVQRNYSFRFKALREKVSAKLSVSETYAHEASIERNKQTLRTLKMFIIVVIVFGSCMFPSQLVWLLTDFGQSPSEFVIFTCYLLTYTNSVLNPWIYGGVNSSFRKAYRQMLLGGRCKGYNIDTSNRITSQMYSKSSPPSGCLPNQQNNNGFSEMFNAWKDMSANQNSVDFNSLQINEKACSVDTLSDNPNVMLKSLTMETWRRVDQGSFDRRLSQHTLEKLKLLNETIL